MTSLLPQGQKVNTVLQMSVLQQSIHLVSSVFPGIIC